MAHCTLQVNVCEVAVLEGEVVAGVVPGPGIALSLVSGIPYHVLVAPKLRMYVERPV